MATGILLILDDVMSMTKIAAKKTAGVLGDDLAVNAEKATGFHASRELPVIWAIAKGSFLNKLIILPIIFLLSAFAPMLIVPILLLGGAYLSFEGAEKVLDWLGFGHAQPVAAAETASVSEIMAQEAGKIRDAIRTDFILSVEIIVIAIGSVIAYPLMTQVLVVGSIAILATIGVYGLVAMLVRMDDVGLHLLERAEGRHGIRARLQIMLGHMLLASLPHIISLLTVVGTIAMLLVGGSMFVHNIDWVHHTLAFMPILLAEITAGLIVGFVVVGLYQVVKRAMALKE